MIDIACVQPVALAGSAIGAELRCTAHGIGDSAPLAQWTRVLSGEALRPPSPCHPRALQSGGEWRVSWVRRSHQSRACIYLVGDTPRSFPELYRLTITGPGGSVSIEPASPEVMLAPSEIRAQAGQAVILPVATVGPLALSHPSTLDHII